jgi:hypothetical protein
VVLGEPDIPKTEANMKSTFRRLGSIVLAAALMSTVPATSQEAVPIDIGSRLEIFADQLLIDSMTGTRLQLHHPVTRENVLAFDKPWEGRYCGYGTVLRDGYTYRLYYRGLPEAGKDGSPTEVTCYAESADGINWTKPSLGIFEVAGTKDNNVVLAGMAPFSHNFAPFLDTRPGVEDEARYKALAGTRATGLVAFASPDGLHWRTLSETGVITDGAFDSQNIAFWSQSEQQYISYFRVFSDGVRSISRTTSPDFLQWSDPVEMSYGDTPREHLYTNQTVPYFRAPHIYIATPARFMPGRRVVTPEAASEFGGEARYSGDCSDTVFMSTRGGYQYDRTFMEAFVRPGLGLENWTSRTNYMVHGVVPTGEGELSLYIQRNYGQPTHHLERLTLRTDGFTSIHAPYKGGEFTTKPITFTGTQLLLNFATSAAGSLWVELHDSQGNAIEGFTFEDSDELLGDFIAQQATWKGNGDLRALAGSPVKLRIRMRDADLYALQFVN